MEIIITILILCSVYFLVTAFHMAYYTMECIAKKEVDLDHIIVDSAIWPLYLILYERKGAEDDC